jgi:hypothetical protein
MLTMHFTTVFILLILDLSSSMFPIRRAKRYQRGNQNPYIEEKQTAQWPQDIKGVIRIRISKKNRQHNGQKKKYKRTNNDLQNIHIKLKIE